VGSAEVAAVLAESLSQVVEQRVVVSIVACESTLRMDSMSHWPYLKAQETGSACDCEFAGPRVPDMTEFRKHGNRLIAFDKAE
jgi:hypothetical protein